MYKYNVCLHNTILNDEPCEDLKSSQNNIKSSNFYEIIRLMYKEPEIIDSNFMLYLGPYHVSLKYDFENHLFYPMSGSSYLLGKIFILRGYEINELIDLINHQNYRIVINLTFKDDKIINSKIENLIKILPYFKIEKLTDYSGIITFLETKGYVQTEKTQNILATDERRFFFDENAIKIMPEIEEFMNEIYEVDFLGSTLSGDLTNVTINLIRKVITS